MEKEIENLIEELIKVTPEMLSKKGLKLFNTIMAILNENAELKKNYINPSKAKMLYCNTKKGTEVVIEGFVPKSKIKEKIKEIQLPNIIVGGRRNCKTLEYGKKLGKLEVLQELMEDK